MTNESQPKLIRGVGVTGATALNMIDMIGVGPFITMPLIIAAMGGPYLTFIAFFTPPADARVVDRNDHALALAARRLWGRTYGPEPDPPSFLI